MALVALAACGEQAATPAGLSYTGPTAQPLDMGIYLGLPTTPVGLGELPLRPMILDTGAPLTIVAAHEIEGIDAGYVSLGMNVFGLRFEAHTIAATDVLEIGEPRCQNTPPPGYLGADVLSEFRVWLDYRGRKLAVLDADDATPVSAEATAAPVTVPIELLGGGDYELADNGAKVALGPTRLIAQVDVEGWTTWALVDTGFSFNVIAPEIYDQLGAQETRPHLCCTTIHLASGGPTLIELTRLRSVQVGDVEATSQPVLILGFPKIMEALSQETGRQIGMILGAPFLERAVNTLDYLGHSWTIATYQDTSHVASDLLLLPGFRYCAASDTSKGVRVLDVYEGFDAEAAGMLPGDFVTAIDGVDMRGADFATMRAAFLAPGEGGSVSLTVEPLGGGEVTREVTLQQLLPEFTYPDR